MTWPREGSREINEGIIVSVPMDWCKSPTAVVPYKIWARQKEAADLASSVSQTDDPSHVLNSLVLKCYGDEAGIGGGVISGTHNAECTPKTWSPSVRFESRNAVRHTDEWWMNHKNTYGKLVYVKDTSTSDPPSPQQVDPKLQQPGPNTSLSKSLGSLPEGAQLYEAQYQPLVQGGGRIILGGLGAAVAAYSFREILINGTKVKLYSGTRTSEKPNKCPCVVAPYLALAFVCGKACKKGQAHHIVPDYTKRYGSRVEGQVGQKRIKGLKGFWQGASICMRGNAKDDDTEHYEAHQADKDVRDLGENHPDTKQYPIGTAPIGQIRQLTEQQAKNAREECSEQITEGVAAEFAGVNPNTLGRTYFDSRFPPSTNTIPALSGRTVHP